MTSTKFNIGMLYRYFIITHYHEKAIIRGIFSYITYYQIINISNIATEYTSLCSPPQSLLSTSRDSASCSGSLPAFTSPALASSSKPIKSSGGAPLRLHTTTKRVRLS